MSNNRLRVCALSDTHGAHNSIRIPKCDVLIHAGDYSGKGISFDDAIDFLQWLDSQPADRKIFCPGNHDGFFEETAWKGIVPDGVDVLIHDWLEIYSGQLKIFGSAYTPEFCNWYFAKTRPQLIEDWKRDAANIVESYGQPDILVCHGPPQGILDEVPDGSKILNVGCEGLLGALDVLKPKLFLSGHIHEALGRQVMLKDTLCVNVSYMDEQYRPVGRVFTIDI